MKRSRFPHSRFLVLSLAAAMLLSATVSSALERTIQNGTDNGSIRVAVQDNGQMAVWRYDGSDWVQQTFGPYSKISILFLAGSDTAKRFSTGYYSPYWTAVSNTPNADNNVITTVFLVDDNTVRITQTTSVTAGPYYRMQWAIENIGSATYSDVRFTHGEDTYLAGNDLGEGHFDNALKMVYVTNVAAGIADLMGFYASADTPFSYYYQNDFSSNFTRMAAWTLDNTVNAANVDAGYSLGWMRDTLAPAETWTIVAYEKFTQAVGVQVIAPAEQGGAPGDVLTYSFTVRNLDAGSADITLSAASANGWTASVVNGSGDPLDNVTLAGGAETVVYVRVTIPSGAEGLTDLLTLTATFGAGDTSTDSTSTTVSGAVVTPAAASHDSGHCGMVVGTDGKILLYLAILLAPVAALKRFQRGKRTPLQG
jgi:hypothetical protein